MSTKIKKVDSIKNMAVFQDFNWALSLRDKGNNIAEFKKINIFYGRNYSGKTTLSRIFRAFETGEISDKYDNPEFQISLMDGSTLSRNDLNNHSQIIRVFNEDFVKDNLRFISNEEQGINSFAIMGKDNTDVENMIKKCEDELGSEESKTGLLGKHIEAKKKYDKANKDFEGRKENLETKLREKANSRSDGIKHNTMYGDANYNVTKLKADIKIVNKDTYKSLLEEESIELKKLLKEESRTEISESIPFEINFSLIVTKARELVEKKIQVSNPIQELLNDSALAEWVRVGREYHQGKRKKCAFCGNYLPSDLWDKLDKHFNKESEMLRIALDKVLESIKAEKQRIPNLLTINKSDFYSMYTQKLDDISNEFYKQSEVYLASLDSIKQQIEKRKKDIFSAFSFVTPSFDEDSLYSVRSTYEEIRDISNKFTVSLSSKKKEARNKLRLDEIYKFITIIGYNTECGKIESLQNALEEAETEKNKIGDKVDTIRGEINELRIQLKDERKGAEKVNHYLNDFFGHQFLSLKPIEENSSEASTGYRFEVFRGEDKASLLSEGECNLIAFCYFMAKLEDIETKDSQPIIWIDDPISSLDSNHIFFVYSIINAKIVTPDKYLENGEEIKRDRFTQLFISTHNLDFLKYIKRLPGASKNRETEYFIIIRTEKKSDIILMPRYLKDYVTEFNFLFHQIYKCANAKIQCDENYDCYYNFGNNARKFLEAFLYFKYPNALDHDNKLERFFGDDALTTSLTDRIDNEFSHLAGLFERSVRPVDVPEMKTTAKFILKKINEKDPEQYLALLDSIGETEEFTED